MECPEKYHKIGEHLIAHSNLPGPRGNLTLAHAFADCFRRDGIAFELIDLLVGWVGITAAEAPVSDPKEYLPFCGILALGAHFCFADAPTKAMILDLCRAAMNDTRWRMREAVAMALQKIAEKEFNTVRDFFSALYPVSTFLEKRAIIAALAHPPVLEDPEIARYSLRISEDIFDDVMAVEKSCRRSAEFTALSKGLQYALSVFVSALPDEGFAVMKQYAEKDDPEIKRIIRSNLGKSRLVKRYPQMVDAVLLRME